MVRTRLKKLPVVRDNRLVGMVSRSDLVRKLADRSEDGHIPTRTDATIREDVMARIRALPWNLRIRVANVMVENGIAHIYGWVRSDVERRALEVVAENTPGVMKVKDHLQRVHLFM
jgi:osmotically-inducible protein OsmY